MNSPVGAWLEPFDSSITKDSVPAESKNTALPVSSAVFLLVDKAMRLFHKRLSFGEFPA
jgi:hypothetical protein